ncbi:CCA tRNA nucleotidyltransferase [Litorivita sp. NS0012-18]|uniref:CCA tRNA nucleotidyltransferase n=1 Tax=Litorivita sp. NS0012-18 TaxID=3127655 RepID=UPI00310BB0F7
MSSAAPQSLHVKGGWLSAPPTQAVCHMLEEAGHQALFVGGCVRNALIGAPVSDIDISTDARPERVVGLAEAAGFRAVPTGIDHGTITVVNGGIAHEITTFRRDVETNGRHAVVAFADGVEEDARRRDFTMNALYCDARGVVIDPLGGMDDLMARRVRFIDDPSARIEEDYLRILRFFRFHAWYGDPQGGMDADALAAIAVHLDGLSGLSAERVTSELRKLLAALDPAPSVAAMRASGVLARVIEGGDDRSLAPLVHLERSIGAKPDAMRRLACLGGAPETALRLSRKEAAQLVRLREAIGAMTGAGELGYRMGYEGARDVLLLRAALFEAPIDAAALPEAEQGAAAQFPVKAQDLMPAYEGAALGAKIAELEARWIASDFSLAREALLSA